MNFNIRSLRKVFISELAPLYPENECRSMFAIVVEFVLGLNRTQQAISNDENIAVHDTTRLLAVLTELKTGKPIQYITGTTEFCGLQLEVNPDVLIPRQETEECIMHLVANYGEKIHRILDLGTGSGCIAISLAKHIENAGVFATDISEKAILTAKRNAIANQCNVNFSIWDMTVDDYSGFPGLFDLIISNPPYITEAEKSLMHSNVLNFEPHSALFVPDDDPLKFYRHIASLGMEKLTSSGLLVVEINENLGNETSGLFSQTGFRNISLRHDVFGKDRFLFMQKNNPKPE
ncbi:MAG: peptide chain release factor N(5)-glutamine methyltransferase [Bacteroidetes bacterium]|nr:peptide chain release factor N(5)-glutamine methyltransferase [Bacteroidota bacterium]MBU1720736.1 peptide chain release factor N(5)-glutamine methyltransferase [Bacteroidota bacterium]